MKHKRFLVFLMDSYYPLGGINDLEGSFDSKEEAIKFAKASERSFYQIYDRIEGEEID